MWWNLRYINRTNELTELREKVEKNDIIFLFACKGYGISCFLKEFEQIHQSELEFSIYLLELSKGRTFSKVLLDYIRANSLWSKLLQRETDKLYGSRKGSLLSIFVSGVPYFGEMPSKLIDYSKKTALPVYIGNYDSILSELIIPLFKAFFYENPNIDLLFLIDSAQFISEDDYNILDNLVTIKNINIVLAFTEENYNTQKIYNYFSGKLDIKIDKMLFKAPNVEMIRKIGETVLSIQLNDHQACQMITENDANLTSIIYYLKSYKNSRKSQLLPIEIAIIHLLNICNFGLSKSFIHVLLKKSNVFSHDFTRDLHIALDTLIENGFVKQNETPLYYLDKLSHPLINECLKQTIDIFYYECLVLDYYRVNPDASWSHHDILEMLFELEYKHKDSLGQSYKLRLLELKLHNGMAVSKNLINAIKFDLRKISDLRLAIFYHCRERNFKEAFFYFEKYIIRKNDLNILKPYLLTYLRDYEAADKEFSVLDKMTFSPEKRCVLFAWKIAHAIHFYGREKAFVEHVEVCMELEGYENYGYFARNIASAAPLNKREDYFISAIENFKLYQDDFGLFSTLCNRGSFLCYNGQPEKGLELLLESANGMRQFGEIHLHISYNNIGMCYMLLNNIPDALKYLSLAEKYAINQSSTSWLIIQINLACIFALNGLGIKSWQLIENIRPKIEQLEVAHLKEKYYSNSLLCAYTCELSVLDDFMQNSKKELQQWVSNDLVNDYQNILFHKKKLPHSKLMSLYHLASLAYWYIDPLKAIF